MTVLGQFLRHEWPHDPKSIYWVTNIIQEEVALAYMAVR